MPKNDGETDWSVDGEVCEKVKVLKGDETKETRDLTLQTGIYISK